ncbi:MAG: hypothetical protein Q9211_001710 [Gyalolechia sp. 1 TL-2023]
MSNPKSGEVTPGTTKTKSTVSMKISGAIEVFRLNGLLFDDPSANKTAHFVALATKVWKSDRASPDRAPLGDNLLLKMTKYSKVNEPTMMHNWFQKVVIEDRVPNESFQPTGGAVAEDDRDDEVVMEGSEEGPVLNPTASAFEGFKAWCSDGVESNWDKDFERGSVPKLQQIDTKELAVLVKLLPRIANPKPDVIYGFADESFTKERRTINVLYSPIAKISDGVNWPFLTIDAKLDGMRALRLQCMRAGSAVVAALRRFFDQAGFSDPDLDSWVFSIAITSALATIHVHWAETASDGSVTYFTKPVAPFNLEFESAHMELRRAISNILDWGVFERKPKIEKALDMLVVKQVAKKDG